MARAPRPLAPTLGSALGVANGAGETLGESLVSTRAQLLVGGSPSYPAEARRAEVEARVPLEIVVDTAGRVVEARVLKAAGYGFDEAATTAVKGYRFSPALREGKPVRVRMRWSVQFQLH